MTLRIVRFNKSILFISKILKSVQSVKGDSLPIAYDAGKRLWRLDRWFKQESFKCMDELDNLQMAEI